MWAENAFVFPNQDTLDAFTHRSIAKPFELIRTLGKVSKARSRQGGTRKLGFLIGYPGSRSSGYAPLLAARRVNFEHEPLQDALQLADIATDRRGDGGEGILLRPQMIVCTFPCFGVLTEQKLLGSI